MEITNLLNQYDVESLSNADIVEIDAGGDCCCCCCCCEEEKVLLPRYRG